MTQKSRPGRCFLLSVPCHSRSRKRFTLPSSFVAGFVFLQHIGWGLGGRYHGWDLDALAERMGCGWTILWLGPGCSGRTDGIWVDDIMVGPGCSGRTDAVWVDDIMVGTWMLWQNGWGLGGRYHDWELDALAVRMGSGAQSCEEVGPGRAEGQRRKEGVGKRPGRCLFIVSGASKPYSNHSGPYIIVRL